MSETHPKGETTILLLRSSLKKLLAEPPATGQLRTALKELATILTALGIQLEFKEDTPPANIPSEIQALAEKRWQAKHDRDWDAADQLRDELAAKGWKVLDRKNGYDIEPV